MDLYVLLTFIVLVVQGFWFWFVAVLDPGAQMDQVLGFSEVAGAELALSNKDNVKLLSAVLDEYFHRETIDNTLDHYAMLLQIVVLVVKNIWLYVSIIRATFLYTRNPTTAEKEV